jgi:release factor glutamine methyltransferase
MDELEPELAYEPVMALYGDADGLYFYRELSGLWAGRLRKKGVFAYEIGMGQHTAVGQLMAQAGLKSICQTRDYSGIIRVLSGER